MKKRLILAVMLVVALACLFAISAFAETPATGRLGTNTIVEGITEPTVIDTTSQIQMDDGKVYPSYYFFKDQTKSAWDFTKVTKEDGSNYTIDNVVKLEIPHGITRLDNMGYRDQNKTTLTHVRIPNTINENSWNGGFRSTKSLTSVEFEEGYSYKIFESMFHSCPVSNFVIPEGVTEIGKESMCAMGLTTIKIPDSVTYIGSSAFTGNSNLQKVIIGEGSQLKKIDGGAFSGLHALTAEFYFPSNLETLGEGVFSSSYNISSFKNLENTKLTNIPKKAFYECRAFKTISLPSTVTSIGESAFQKCSLVENINFTGTLTSVSKNAFDSCKALKGFNGTEGISFGEGFTSVGNFAFNECDAIKFVDFPSTINYLGQGAFAFCDNLQIVSFDKVDAKIRSAIANGESYTKVTFNNCGTFKGCKNLVAMCVPEGTTTIINRFVGQGCTSLTAFYMPNSVAEIGTNGGDQGAFCGANSMYFVQESFTVGQCIVNGTVDLSKLDLPEKPSVYYMPTSFIGFIGHVESNASSRGGTVFAGCKSINDTIVFGENFVSYNAYCALKDIGTEASPKNVVFLGDMTGYVTTQNTAYVSFIFANKADKSPADIGITHVYKNSNNNGSYMYFCYDGSRYNYSTLSASTTDATEIATYIAGLEKTNDTKHVAKPGATSEVEATCLTNKALAHYCFCGEIAKREDVENTALGHEFDATKGAKKLSVGYTNYLANGTLEVKCARCEECEIKDAAPIISDFKGFSAREEGDGVTFGYVIDYDALNEYVKLNGKNVELGFVVALQSNSANDAPELSAATSITAKVVTWTTDDEANLSVAKYTGADFIIRGDWTGHENTVFCMAGYLIDGEDVSYLNVGSSSEKADTFSYAQFLAIEE